MHVVVGVTDSQTDFYATVRHDIIGGVGSMLLGVCCGDPPREHSLCVHPGTTNSTRCNIVYAILDYIYPSAGWVARTAAIIIIADCASP